MNSIFTKDSLTGQLIELGIGLLPEVIGSLKSINPSLPQILADSNEFAEILIVIAQKEKKDLDS